MSNVNRVLQYLRSPCPCAAASRELESVRAECLAIEATCEGAIEFHVPSMLQFVDGNRNVALFVASELDEATIGTDLATHTIQQLRGAARELTAAADRLEGTVNP